MGKTYRRTDDDSGFYRSEKEKREFAKRMRQNKKEKRNVDSTSTEDTNETQRTKRW